MRCIKTSTSVSYSLEWECLNRGQLAWEALLIAVIIRLKNNEKLQQANTTALSLRQLSGQGPVIIYRRGGGEGFGAKQCEILADPPFECYFTEVIPPNNIWWLSRFPPASSFHFPSQFEWSPPESFQSFQWSPLLGSRLRLTPPPPFCSPKTQVIPPKNPPPLPPPQAINNDWSLRASDRKLGGSWVQFSAGARNFFITFLVLDFSIWKKKDSVRYANKFVSKSVADSHEPEHC